MTPARPCEAFALHLAALSAGELEPSLREAAENHLAGCPECAALFASLLAQRDELAALMEPEGFKEALEETRKRVLEQVAVPPPSPWYRNRWMPRVAAVAAFALFAGALWWRFGNHTRPTKRTAPATEIARVAPTARPAPEPPPADSARTQPATPSAARRKGLPKNPATHDDPVAVARRILESGGGGLRPVLVQESPEAVVYWLATPTGGV